MMTHTFRISMITALALAVLFVGGCTTLLNPNSPPPEPAAVVADAAEPADSVESTDDSDKMVTPEDNPSYGIFDPALDAAVLEAEPLTPPDAAEAPASPQPQGKNVQSYIDEALDYVQVAQDFWESGELDNALEALDLAYSLILKVEHFDNPVLLQQKEDLRFTISKRILEIYASRYLVVNGAHDEIPVEINRHVKAEIERFTVGSEREFFAQSLKRSGRYRPYIVRELRAAGLPEEISWLPLIESGYKIRALSKARALGLWQFIPSTGYKFGLKRDLYIDERLDPEKATAAAIAYLKELHQMFGDWTTVLAAYNSGEGRVLRVIRDQQINYLDNFWDLYERLPLETARYVPRFLATLHIVRNLDTYGLDTVVLDAPLEFETVSVTRRMQLKDVAAALDVDLATLRTLNPELRYGVLPPESYELNLPPESTDRFLAALDQIPVSSAPRRAFVYHRVRHGETLSTIAERYRTSVRSIQVANNIRHKNFIRAGQKLKIPQKGTRVYPVVTASKVTSAQPGGTHVVSSGESLWIIARRYGVSINAIKADNNLRSTRLHVGQELRIPGTAPVAVAKNRDGVRTYTVRRGDSPYLIARRYNMPLQKFLQINNLSPSSRIYPGQVLYLE